MSDRVFLDTNILVYAIETGGQEPKKSKAALELVRRSEICLSTQVLGEFYRAVTSRCRAVPLTYEQAVAWLQLWKRFEVSPITVSHVDLALDLTERHQVSYFDALILSAARLAKCETLYSEDFNTGQDYGGVLAQNPFG